VSDIFTGGGPVFPDTLRRLLDTSAGLRVVAVYGSTEAEPIAEIATSEMSPADWAEMKAGGGLLTGRAVPGLDLRLVEGEIQVAGAHVNEGYLDPAQNRENKLREAGRVWHRTGDAGRLDAEGRLWLLGRWRPGAEAGPMPLQVETAARFWPGVHRAALLQGDAAAAVLAVEGEGSYLEVWRKNGKDQGITRVVHVKKIPLDRRHASKVDQNRLRRLVGG